MLGGAISRRRFLEMSGGALVASVLSACGGPAAPTAKPAEPVATAVPAKAELSGAFRYAYDNETETRRPAIELFFQKNYPGVKPEFEVTPEGYEPKLMAQIAAGDPPDLAYVHESRFADFAIQGAWLPLDDFLAKTPLIDGNDKYPLETVKRNNFWNGHWYALPVGLGFYFVRYNKDMFTENNVPLPNDKWTWSEFLSSAGALTKDTNNDNTPDQWGWIGWNPGWVTAQWCLMQSYGSFHFADDLSECIINNDAGVEVLDFMRSTWCGETRCSPAPAAKNQLQQGTIRLFEGGLAAMDGLLSPQVSSSLANIAGSGKFEMGIEMFPSGPKGSFIRAGGSENAIPRGAKRPELSWEVLRYIVGDEEGCRIAATYMDGNPCLRMDYILKYNVPEGPLKEKMTELITKGFSQHGTVVQYAPVGEYPRIFGTNADKLATCEITAKQCADGIAEETNKLLKEVLG